VNHGIGCHLVVRIIITAWPDGTDSDSDDSTLAIGEARRRRRGLRKTLVFRARIAIPALAWDKRS
jgi:hypothetical protein